MVKGRKPVDDTVAVVQGVDAMLRRFNLLGTTAIDEPTTDADSQFTGPTEFDVSVASAYARADQRAVADFVCNGTNDEREINAAITMAGQGGSAGPTAGTVRLSQGVFNVSNQIDLGECDLVGSGVGGNWLFETTKNYGTTILMDDDAYTDDYVIKGGAGATHRGAVTNLEVEVDCTATGLESIVYASYCERVKVSQTTDTFARCMEVRSTLNCEVSSAHNDGLLTVFGGTHTGNRISAPDTGFTVDLLGPSIVQGNYISQCTVGIAVQAADTSIVGNDIFLANVTDAIGIQVDVNRYRAKVLGNSVSLHTSATTSTGIRVNGDQTTVVGNVIDSAGANDGIVVDADVTEVLVSSNRIDDVTNGIYVALGTGTLTDKIVIVSNMVTNSDVGIYLNDVLGDITMSGNHLDATAPVDDQSTSIVALNEDVIVAQWEDTATTLATTTGVQPWIMTGAGTVVDVRCIVNTAPTGAALIVDVNVNTASLFSVTKPTIAISAKDSGLTVPDTNMVLIDGDVLTFDIDQIGSTIAGGSLTVIARVRRHFYTARSVTLGTGSVTVTAGSLTVANA